MSVALSLLAFGSPLTWLIPTLLATLVPAWTPVTNNWTVPLEPASIAVLRVQVGVCGVAPALHRKPKPLPDEKVTLAGRFSVIVIGPAASPEPMFETTML